MAYSERARELRRCRATTKDGRPCPAARYGVMPGGGALPTAVDAPHTGVVPSIGPTTRPVPVPPTLGPTGPVADCAVGRTRRWRYARSRRLRTHGHAGGPTPPPGH